MKPFVPLAALALVARLSAAPAAAQEVTLTLHHFLGPNSPTHAQFIAPWAERIEAESGGRIAVEVFPAMALGGKPPELFRQARDGVADIVWTLAGYTPGVFPRAEVFELPTVHRGSAAATNAAIQDVWPLIEADFADVKPLLVHVHAGNALHLRSDGGEGLAPLAGLKLRTPSRTGAWLIEAIGAEPVGMPVPELPQALARGAVDGALVPFEIVPPLKLHELTALSLEGEAGLRFGTSVFLFLMNRDRYEALPDDLKAVIDANAGPALAARAGAVWDAIEAPGKALQVESGGRVARLDAAGQAAFEAQADVVVARWVAEADAAGVDGSGLAAAARAAVAAHSE